MAEDIKAIVGRNNAAQQTSFIRCDVFYNSEINHLYYGSLPTGALITAVHLYCIDNFDVPEGSSVKLDVNAGLIKFADVDVTTIAVGKTELPIDAQDFLIKEDTDVTIDIKSTVTTQLTKGHIAYVIEFIQPR